MVTLEITGLSHDGLGVGRLDDEVIFVSPLALGSPLIDPTASGIVPSLARDLKLMQAPIEPPPPRHQRIAIDRLLMMPLRSRLALAVVA